MKMVGPIRRLIGLQVGGMGDAWPEDLLSGMTGMETAEDNPSGTKADVYPLNQALPLDPIRRRPMGVPDRMAMVGRILVMHSSMNQLSRDTDGDGYGDEADGNEPDACPTIRGTSILDRFGCRDTDGDGWSDPTDDWDAHPYGSADAFPTEALQWKDSDADGFGDVPLGALRDDCPEVFGTSMRDLQGCEDNNGDGWSMSTVSGMLHSYHGRRPSSIMVDVPHRWNCIHSWCISSPWFAVRTEDDRC